MKKIYYFLTAGLIATFLFSFSTVQLQAQEEEEYYDDDEYYEDDEYYDDEYYDDEYYYDDELPPVKAVFVDVGIGSESLIIGHGPHGLSGAVGFRWSMVGLSLGIGGLTNDLPVQSPYTDQISGNTKLDTMSSLLVSVDAYYFYDYTKNLSFFANIGYCSISDSVLVYDYNTEAWYRNPTTPQVISTDGFTFGAGFQYVMSEYLFIGAGYHSKRGLYGQLSYYWR